MNSTDPTISTQMTHIEQSPVGTVETTGKKELALIKAGATREISYKTMVAALEAESMTVDKFGDEHMTPDHSTRIRAAELISRLNGDLKDAPTVDNRTVNINVGNEAMDGLLHFVKDMAYQLKSLRTDGKQTGEIIDLQVEHG